MNIGGVTLSGRLCLAPMAGVSDAAFRLLCRRHGAALCCTEMISSKALMYQDRKTRTLLVRPEGDLPLAAQLFGSDPACMGEAAEKLVELCSPEIVDINMGCPVGKIAGNGDGSGLMKTPELARDIVAAVVAAVPGGTPVTVKMRKGWDKGSVNAVELALLCQDAGAAAVTVHGRTRTQMYEGRADWDILREVKRALSIPVIANGDVFSGADAAHILDYTGCDGAMIGRGAFGDPWIFEEGNAALAGLPIPEKPPLTARIDTAVAQIAHAAALRGERLACLEARRHLCWYLRGVPYAAAYKAELVRVETLEDVRRAAAKLKRNLT